ncbi:hypothetical protein Tco_0915974, partial [Tanacetum coccineum]
QLAYLHYTKFKQLQVKRRVPTFKSWNTSLWKKRETIELENLWMGMTDIQEVIDEGEETAQREKVELEEKINENLVKFQNDVKPIQLMERMKEIFKEPHIPEHYSSSSTESDDDNDDVHNGSELGDDNQRSYGSYSDSSDEDYIRMVRQAQEEERNDPTDDHNDEECVSDPEDEGRKMITKKVVIKDAKEEGSSKKDKGDGTKEEGRGKKEAANKKN